MNDRKSRWVVLGLLLTLAGLALAQQEADPDFDATVERPAYDMRGPVVVLDEAHANFHTASGRYEPFVLLLMSDGYQVRAGLHRFDQSGVLDEARVLVIANAGAAGADEAEDAPAFTEAECDAVRDWVAAGGSLLLIADHAPFGGAAERLALRFGVGMGKGYVFDAVHSAGSPSLLVFSRENGLLGRHPVFEGRDPQERVARVQSFTGQSLTVPKGASVLLRLGPEAREAPSREALAAAQADPDSAPGVGGRAQGVALRHGKGRVVILGEAAMFSAQVIRYEEGGVAKSKPMGMNVPGNDDRQFALNVLHWLSGALD